MDREIQRLQDPSSPDLLVPRAAFCRLVKEVLDDILKSDSTWQFGDRPLLSDVVSMSFQSTAPEVLQHAAEGFLVEMFEDGGRVALHARRRTLMLKDITFLRYLKRDPNLEPPIVFKTRAVTVPTACLLEAERASKSV